jgi:mycofactocin biosynthesis protein MftB
VQPESSPTGTDAPPSAVYDGSRSWALARQVALRPEPFGALAYHFGTRRLSFLKSRTLLSVVEGLADHPTGDEACTAAGIGDSELPTYRQALTRLAGSGMIVPRTDR